MGNHYGSLTLKSNVKTISKLSLLSASGNGGKGFDISIASSADLSKSAMPELENKTLETSSPSLFTVNLTEAFFRFEPTGGVQFVLIESSNY